MRVRARPDGGSNPAFPVLVCEAPIPSGTASAAIEGRALPLPKPALGAVAVLGDTGCRMKSSRLETEQRGHARSAVGNFQDCNRTSKWPFAQVSRAAAARKPDLVVHVGDYYYRESPCPPADLGCRGSPSGDNWASWNADFFTPAAPLLAAAPWIATRGNHESCERGGAGFFRFLDPGLAKDGRPPACIDFMPPYTVKVAGRSFIVMDVSHADDECREGACDSLPYAAQFAALSPAPGSVLVSHRPVWGLGRNFALNKTLQQALGRWDGRLPPGIELALAGHMHIFEVLSFADGRSPQLVIGTGGTQLDRKITRRLAGLKVGSASVAYARTLREFGFAMLAPRADAGGWNATFVNVAGLRRLGCSIGGGQVACRRGGRP
jgi:hypothetical protein